MKNSSSRWRRLVTVVIMATMMLSSTFLAQPIKAADDYPSSYKTAGMDSVIDVWNFYNRECTSYVAWRMNRDHGITDISATQWFVNGMKGPNGQSGLFGNASTWYQNAVNIGFAVDGGARVGDIAWFSFGHVAYVESVNSDGTVNISQYNQNFDGLYTTRNNVTANHYIHVNNIGVWSTWASQNAIGKGEVNMEVYKNKLYQAMRGTNDAIYTRSFDGTSWSGWDNGGITAAAINLKSFDSVNGKLYEAIRGTDNAVYTRSFNGTSWSSWDKSGLTTTTEIKMEVFNHKLYQSTLGTDQGIYTRWFDGGVWSPWEKSGIAGSTINLAVYNGRLYETTTGTDQGMYTRSSDGNTWTGWDKSGIAKSDIRMEVFNGKLFQAARGTDDGIYTRSFDGSTWSGWDKSGITAATINMKTFNGKLYQAIVGTDQVIYTRSFDGNSWTGWVNSGTTITPISMQVYNSALYQAVIYTDSTLYVRSLR